VAASSIESTTFLGHEAAILSVFDGLTNHFKLTPSIYFFGPDYLIWKDAKMVRSLTNIKVPVKEKSLSASYIFQLSSFSAEHVYFLTFRVIYAN
jgi:hypothetical protein